MPARILLVDDDPGLSEVVALLLTQIEAMEDKALSPTARRCLVDYGRYLERHPVGQLLYSPADISWGPDILVQPDIFIAPWDEVRTLTWERIQHLLLVIEILSPTTARADRFTKRRLYQEVRVPTYWIVDVDERLVEVWTPDADLPAVEREGVEWLPEGAAEPFVLSVPELLRPV